MVSYAESASMSWRHHVSLCVSAHPPPPISRLKLATDITLSYWSAYSKATFCKAGVELKPLTDDNILNNFDAKWILSKQWYM